MINLYHGEYTIASYEALQKQKDKYRGKEIITLNGDSLTVADLEIPLSGNTLFAEEKLIIIEGLLTARPSKRKDEVIEKLINSSDGDILLYEDKEATKTQLNKIPNIKATNFKAPESIFSFVDSIDKTNRIESVKKLQKLTKTEPAEIIYTMIIRQFRNLILVKEGNPKYLGGLPPWMVGKYKRQASDFSMNELLIQYRKLLDIDFKIKSGLTPLPLPKLLDIFLLTL